MKYFIVLCSWEGIEDTYIEEFSGIHHATREEARQELIEAKRNYSMNMYTFYIKEVTL